MYFARGIYDWGDRMNKLLCLLFSLVLLLTGCAAAEEPATEPERVPGITIEKV